MSSPFSAVKPSAKLSDQVASALEAEICAGRFQAAQKLPTEAVLAQQLQVSRTVVREAISRLKSLGCWTYGRAAACMCWRPASSRCSLMYPAPHSAVP